MHCSIQCSHTKSSIFGTALVKFTNLKLTEDESLIQMTLYEARNRSNSNVMDPQRVEITLIKLIDHIPADILLKKNTQCTVHNNDICMYITMIT